MHGIRTVSSTTQSREAAAAHISAAALTTIVVISSRVRTRSSKAISAPLRYEPGVGKMTREACYLRPKPMSSLAATADADSRRTTRSRTGSTARQVALGMLLLSVVPAAAVPLSRNGTESAGLALVVVGDAGVTALSTTAAAAKVTITAQAAKFTSRLPTVRFTAPSSMPEQTAVMAAQSDEAAVGLKVSFAAAVHLAAWG